MIVEIPLQNSGTTQFSVVLDKNEINIRTYFNPMIPIWCMDIRSQTGELNFKGLNMVSGVNLIDRSPRMTRIYGYFRMLETASTLESLGTTARLFWYSTADEYFGDYPPLDPTLAPLNYHFEEVFTSHVY